MAQPFEYASHISHTLRVLTRCRGFDHVNRVETAVEVLSVLILPSKTYDTTSTVQCKIEFLNMQK
jgi:hypothetical protein